MASPLKMFLANRSSLPKKNEVTFYRPDISPEVARVIRHLPPDIKKEIKEAIRFLCQDPRFGEPLGGPLEGRWKYRIRSFRIVYEIKTAPRELRIIAVAHRRTIYNMLITQKEK